MVFEVFDKSLAFLVYEWETTYFYFPRCIQSPQLSLLPLQASFPWVKIRATSRQPGTSVDSSATLARFLNPPKLLIAGIVIRQAEPLSHLEQQERHTFRIFEQHTLNSIIMQHSLCNRIIKFPSYFLVVVISNEKFQNTSLWMSPKAAESMPLISRPLSFLASD